jgi:hypothetical protein
MVALIIGEVNMAVEAWGADFDGAGWEDVLSDDLAASVLC